MGKLHRKVFIILLPLAAIILFLGYDYYQARQTLNIDRIKQTVQFAAVQGSEEISQTLEAGLAEFDQYDSQISGCHDDSLSIEAIIGGQPFSFDRFAMVLATDPQGNIIYEKSVNQPSQFNSTLPKLKTPFYPVDLLQQLVQVHEQQQAQQAYRKSMRSQVKQTLSTLNAQGQTDTPLARSLNLQLRHLAQVNTQSKALIAYLPAKQVEAFSLPFTGGTFYLSRPLANCQGELIGFYSVIFNNQALERKLESIRKILEQHQLDHADISVVHNASSVPMFPLSHISLSTLRRQPLSHSPLAREAIDDLGIIVNSPINVTLQSNHSRVLTTPSALQARQFGLNLLIYIPYSVMEQDQDVLFDEMAFYILLSLLMFVILSGYLAYTIVSPISYLTHQAQLLASGGDVTIKTLKRNDEIGELSLAFEKMAITIQSKQQSLTEQAHHDPLTGILNRRALLEDATSTIRANASVCMMDLDHFKQINDQFGHAAGDSVLQYFCELVKAEIRTHDIFGRIGGEEFTLVLPQTHLEQAVKLAERIREKTEQHLHTVLTSPAPFPVTVSIGVTEWRSGDFHKVLSRADQCLYQAKRAGRNQVIATTDQPSS